MNIIKPTQTDINRKKYTFGVKPVKLNFFKTPASDNKNLV
jgi:hypothetical protein